MNQLEQDIINSANVKLAGIAKGMLSSALGGAAAFGGREGAVIGSLLGGTIGAVKNYRNSAGTFGNRLKAGLTGGLRGGAKGGLIGGGIGVGIGSSAALLGDELRARADVVDALRRVGNIRQNGYTGYEFLDYRPMKLMSYLEGLNSNGDNYNSRHLLDSVFGKANEVANARYNAPIFYQPGSEFNTLKKDALKKAREIRYAHSPRDNFILGTYAPGELFDYLRRNPKGALASWRLEFA